MCALTLLLCICISMECMMRTGISLRGKIANWWKWCSSIVKNLSWTEWLSQTLHCKWILRMKYVFLLICVHIDWYVPVTTKFLLLLLKDWENLLFYNLLLPSGTERTDVGMFPEVDSTWKVRIFFMCCPLTVLYNQYARMKYNFIQKKKKTVLYNQSSFLSWWFSFELSTMRIPREMKGPGK